MTVPGERTVVLLAGLFKIEPRELVAGTSYPQAKAERLPPVACRYTEVELQLALLRRDLEWTVRVGPGDLANQVIVEWRARIEALRRSANDTQERKLLEAAHEQLREHVATLGVTR